MQHSIHELNLNEELYDAALKVKVVTEKPQSESSLIALGDCRAA
jgi:hypothetical protein